MKAVTLVCSISVFLVFGGFLSQEASAEYGGGTGSQFAPYLISEPAHLLAIGGNPGHWGQYFKLTNDIDMANDEWTEGNIIGGTPTFTGWFDGDGFVIRNLHYTGTSRGVNGVGLFGRIADYGTVTNLGLVNVNLDVQGAASEHVGGLVGNLWGGIIDNCYAHYTITTGDGALYVGGLAGRAAGAMINSQSQGLLTVGKGSRWIGGLAGYAGSTINNCRTSGAIVTVGTGVTSQYIGGLAGEFTSSTVHLDNCSSTCSITPGGAADYVGGLVGRHTQGTISNSSSGGAVRGNICIGGLVGGSVMPEGSSGGISHCYSTAEVTASGGRAGGLAGYTEHAVISNSHSTGAVTTAEGAQQTGGLVGGAWYSGSITNCFSTSPVSGGENVFSMGGLLGLASNIAVTRCYSTGPVVAGGADTRFVGGLIGSGGGTMAPVTDCYSLSSVDGGAGSRWVGGLIGQTHSNGITRCFSAGAVLSSGDCTGGLIGENFDGTATVSGCCWDKDASGKDTSAGGKGYTTAVMQQQSTFQSLGWDFAATWKMYAYPGLAWQPDIEAAGELSATVAQDEQGYIDIAVYSLRNVTINWTLNGYDTCGWITGAAPASGTSTGPAHATTVRLTIDASALSAGQYSHELTLAGDNGETVTLPISLRVFKRIKLDAFALLASHWQTTGCDFGQPCKAADWHIDGVIDIKDVAQLADGWLGEEIVKVKASIAEGFDSGDFSALDWQHGGDAPWTIDAESFEGAWAARSGVIGNGQTSVLEITLDLTGWEVDTIWFAWRTSSETEYDILRFYIDDIEKFSRSGVMASFSHFVYPGGITFTPGVRTFKWVYSKDPGDFTGQDCAWIDSIRIYAR